MPLSSFGFAVAVHPDDADTAWFVPGEADERRVPVDGALVVNRTRDGGRSFEMLRSGLAAGAAATTSSTGTAWRSADDGRTLLMGSTTGGLWASGDGGERWRPCRSNAAADLRRALRLSNAIANGHIIPRTWRVASVHRDIPRIRDRPSCGGLTQACAALHESSAEQRFARCASASRRSHAANLQRRGPLDLRHRHRLGVHRARADDEYLSMVQNAQVHRDRTLLPAGSCAAPLTGGAGVPAVVRSPRRCCRCHTRVGDRAAAAARLGALRFHRLDRRWRIVANLLGLWLQHEVLQSVAASTLNGAAIPPQAARSIRWLRHRGARDGGGRHARRLQPAGMDHPLR